MWYITYKANLVDNKVSYKFGIISAIKYHENQAEIQMNYQLGLCPKFI